MTDEDDGDDGKDLTDAAAILWEEARRQVSSQADEVDLLRNRAVALLSVASLVAGLFGGRIISSAHQPTHTTIGLTVALVAFALSVIAIVIVLAPRTNWQFSENLESYFSDIDDGDLRPIDVTARLGQHSVSARENNQKKLDMLYPWFMISCILIGIQVVAWGVAAL
jgi:hypothetical protein